MPLFFAHISKRLDFFGENCYNKVSKSVEKELTVYVSSAMRGGPVYEYSTCEIRGRGCKTWIAE